MRLTREKILNAGTAQLNDWVDEHLMSGHFTTSNDLPKWSSDIDAAWKVVEKFEDAHLVKTPTRGYTFYIQLARKKLQADGETAPVAICKAALLSVIDA